MIFRNRSLVMDLAVAGLLLVVTIALFSPILTEPETLIYNKDIDYFFAHEVVIDNSYAQGDFPLWNPYFGGGSPGLSKIQVGLFYPPMVLLRFLLPVVARLNWDAVLNVFIAGLGIYWLLRDLATSRTAALFGAVAFMFSGSIIPRVFAGHVSVLHAVVWTGWLLFAYRRMLYHRSWWYMVLTALFSAFIVLGGHPQFSAMVLLVPISYFTFVYSIENVRNQRWSELARGFAMSALVAVFSAGLTAAQVLPFAEWLNYTPRGTGAAFDSFEVMTRNSLQLYHLVTPFMPLAWFRPETSQSINLFSSSYFWEVSPFVGIVTILLIITGLLRSKHLNWHLVIYFIGMASFALAMSMGTYNPAYHFIHDNLPFIRAPGRILLLWTFALAVLAGISLDGLLKILSSSDRRALFQKPAYATTAFSLLMITLVVWWYAHDNAIPSQLLTQGYLANSDPALLQALLQRSTLILVTTLLLITGLFWSATIPAVKSELWGWLAIGVLLFEVTFFARPLVRPFPVNRLIDPQNPLAILDIDPAEVRMDGYRTPPNYLVPTLIHVHNGEEHLALQNLLRKPEKGRQLLSASYYATVEPVDEPEMELVQQKDAAYLYRDVSTSPRIYASGSVRFVYDDDEALDFVFSDSFNQFEQSVVTLSLEDEAVSFQEPGFPPAGKVDFSAKYMVYGNDRIVAQVIVDQSAMVVFDELYFPGWQATVDGEPTNIYKANYAFRGVFVGKGEHIIEMRFSPPSFRLGAALSLATILVIVVISMWRLRQHVSKTRL